MARISINLMLDNDAFWTDADTGDPPVAAMRLDREAVAELLRDIAENVETGVNSERVVDRNGNTIGDWLLTGQDS